MHYMTFGRCNVIFLHRNEVYKIILVLHLYKIRLHMLQHKPKLHANILRILQWPAILRGRMEIREDGNIKSRHGSNSTSETVLANSVNLCNQLDRFQCMQVYLRISILWMLYTSSFGRWVILTLRTAVFGRCSMTHLVAAGSSIWGFSFSRIVMLASHRI